MTLTFSCIHENMTLLDFVFYFFNSFVWFVYVDVGKITIIAYLGVVIETEWQQILMNY